MTATTFDFVIVGGGSAGAVLAARLSEEPGTTVALIEAGGEGRGPLVEVPAGTVAMLPTPINNWALRTTPQPGLGGRRGYQPRGKALGGSSATNAMVYIRGHRWDYDNWAELGNTGWSYDEVLPYFRRAEANERLGGPLHGQDGPLPVSDLRTDNPFHAHLRAAARACGLPLNDDFNGVEQEGLGVYQVTQRNGERWSSARAYLEPVRATRGSLTVLTHAHAQRVLLEGRRAVGVELLQGGVRSVLRARREVVVAAGAFHSPQLLMCSGIGDAQALRAAGVAPLHHLPGVGRNLQDHIDFIFGWRLRTLDLIGISLAGSARLVREALRYRRERRGLLTTNFAEAGGFLRLSPASPAPDVQLLFVTAIVDDHARRVSLGHGFSCHVGLMRPRSRGSVGLDGPTMATPPRIDPRFYEHPDDLERMVQGFKLTRRLLQQLVALPEVAAMKPRELFTRGVASDDDIRAVLRARSDTVYHPVGTCAMGHGDMAVVDAELRVHGVQGLRVADASVMPVIVGGNTNAPTIMIAEKAADLIRHGRPRPQAATQAAPAPGHPEPVALSA